ncbi:MAG: hypothetical protein RLZZ312_874 [Bacteroidota bacterium]
MQQENIVIIGGGLAGLTAAIHLSKNGKQVTVIEKNSYPRHKVCGEYISNEVLPYFKSLDLDIDSLHPTKITDLHFSTCTGKSLKLKLPLGGFGISRYILDEYLYTKAIENGCKFIFDQVSAINFIDDIFEIKTNNHGTFNSKIALGAFGKRSNIDIALQRKFISRKSNWLAVKAHYFGDFDNNLVGLHNFSGGYCGISKVENDRVNVCYITNHLLFKTYKSIAEFQNRIVYENPFLKHFFETSTMIFDKPLTISQISFNKKHLTENHILMIGDSAGLIHPLCGNGMAMAIRSAKIASELIDKYFQNKIESRYYLEKTYCKQWNHNFRKRLFFGQTISNILQKPKLATFLIRIFIKIPNVVFVIVKNTHGKPF